MNRSSRIKPIRAKILLPNQHYRQSIGNRTNWQSRRQGSQQDQDNRVQRLSRQPGLHSGNVHRQNATQAMVQLLGILSSARISDANPATSSKSVDALSIKNKIPTPYVNRSPEITLRTNPKHHAYIVKDIPTVRSQKYMQATSVTSSQLPARGERYQKTLSPLHSENINKISPSSQYKTSSLKKRNISPTENIPNKILSIVNDNHFHTYLRNVLSIVFKLSQKAPEIRFVPEEDKNLFILMKCIQQLNIFIIKDNPFGTGQEILAALLKIADDLDTPHAKAIFGKFKEQFISESANTAIKASDLSMFETTHKMRLVGDMIVFNPNNNTEIIFKEQTRHLFRLLGKHGLVADQSKLSSIINNLIIYLSQQDHKKRITRVARHLLKPLGMNDSDEREHISDERKMSMIAKYMNHALFSMSLDQWIAKQIQTKGMHKDSSFTNRDLELWLHQELWLKSALDPSSNKGELSQEARKFYRDNILNKSLPILTLQLNTEESKKLHNMDITQPRWGFIHAGALFLNDSSAGLAGLTLADIEDTGIMLNTMLLQGAAPEEYAGYFRLPTLLHYARTDAKVTDLPVKNEQEMQQAFQYYFNYIDLWEKNNNPFVQLPNLIQEWKSRTALATETLLAYRISDKWTSNYLNGHNKIKFISKKQREESFGQAHPFTYINSRLNPAKTIILPNIDKIFTEQNLKLANAAYGVDGLMLPQVFNSLSENEQRFIEHSKVDKVRIQFNARDSINKIPISHKARMGMNHASALIYRIPDHIDLLACTLNGEERIYALEILIYSGEYTLKRVDRNRQALLDLLEDSSVPSRDTDYQIRVISHATLKEQTETSQKLIEKLSELHKKKLLTELYNQGYDKTTQEKISDFLLSLIPLYTCITESSKGNTGEAVSACFLDAVSLLPFAGKTFQTGMRFSTALGGTAAVALRYGARQAMVKEMLQQTGRELFKHSPFLAREISPQVLRKLTNELLSDLDPGFGLLMSIGIGGQKVTKYIFQKIANKSPAMLRVMNALKNSAHVDPTVLKPKNTKGAEAGDFNLLALEKQPKKLDLPKSIFSSTQKP
jgi:hypothetical protein